MAEETLYCVVLPSGRVAKIVEPTLERTWEVTEQAGTRVGNSTNPARAQLEIARELVRVHLRAITRGAVPWMFKKGAEVDQDALRAELEALFGAGAALLDIKAKLAVLDVPPEEVDLDRMVQAARDGAGGGFLPITYKDLIKADGELSLKALFNRQPRDFQQLEMQINLLQGGQRDPKAPPAAALLGRRVTEITS